MIGLMFPAFHPTRFADFCANLAERRRKLRTAAHQRRGGPAGLRAVFVEADALRHHFYVPFRKACVATMFARLSATDTSFDTRLVLRVSHRGSPVRRNMGVWMRWLRAKDIPKAANMQPRDRG
jgi:hypothetical protein